MKPNALCLALVLALPIAAIAQATLTGTWQGELPNGVQVVLDVTAKGASLMGTLTEGEETAAITEGTVSKNTFTFLAMLDGRNDAFTGEIGDEQVRLWPDRAGPERAIILKRAKSARSPNAEPSNRRTLNRTQNTNGEA